MSCQYCGWSFFHFSLVDDYNLAFARRSATACLDIVAACRFRFGDLFDMVAPAKLALVAKVLQQCLLLHAVCLKPGNHVRGRSLPAVA